MLLAAPAHPCHCCKNWDDIMFIMERLPKPGIVVNHKAAPTHENACMRPDGKQSPPQASTRRAHKPSRQLLASQGTRVEPSVMART